MGVCGCVGVCRPKTIQIVLKLRDSTDLSTYNNQRNREFGILVPRWQAVNPQEQGGRG